MLRFNGFHCNRLTNDLYVRLQRREHPPADNACCTLKRPSTYEAVLLRALDAAAWQLPLTSFAPLRGDTSSYLRSMSDVIIPQIFPPRRTFLSAPQ